MTIAYNGDDNKTILIRTNADQAQSIDLPRLGDGSWNQMHSKSLTVSLAAGDNTIAVSGTIGDAGWMNIDYIELLALAQ